LVANSIYSHLSHCSQRDDLPPLLAYLESVTPESGVLVGTNISIADIAIITCFAQAQYGDYEVDGTSYPKLRAYLDRCFANSIVTDRLESEKAMFANR
jgi:glutathione S-transferase